LGKTIDRKTEARGENLTEEQDSRTPRRPFWSGTITIGLVNVPVKLYTMTFDRAFTFRFLHKLDGQPLKYQRVCIKENIVVPWEDTVKGYEVSKNHFITFSKEELKSAEPQTSQKIRIDKFVDYLSVDPVHFEKSYILTPDKNDEAYSLLLTALQTMNKAGAGKITLRTKEYPVLLHAYKGALVITTLRYAYEVADPARFEELKNLKEPEKKELDLAKKIITDLSGEFDITEYEDAYEERIRQLIMKKMKGETIVAEKPPKEEARELMTALQETLKQLKQK
jgi:DNA end-binding protein Ku